MKMTWPMALTLVAGVTAAAAIPLQTAFAEPIWQTTSALQVEIGIRDKYGNSGISEISFVVSGPQNTLFLATRSIGADQFGGGTWATVTFPNDFAGASDAPGKYKWEAVANGKKVNGGTFEFSPYSSHRTLTTHY